ncbi:MAG: TIR domain-containing protein [Ruminococcaceae bacterium]|nr:TIR domain-containing protein [Oscillospiraceae bacterium]
MAVLKCKMCGGNLDITEGMTVCECEYCGTKQTVPNANNEKKINLFNRANRLRSACEFDKAASVYESIVAEFSEEAEAYWGLCLCKFGIEYVDDPKTAKKIPTCHRTSYSSIFDDYDFDLACEYADSVALQLYRNEAKEIDQLQREILNIAKKEEPFDIFICYKENDENGQRTKDSVMAQDIYDAFTLKGYKVFFSRITLEDKLGQEFEPYIFAALYSAKILLAIGTKYEYYNSVWVKNEWSRFLGFMKNNREKVLIPCYADIDAYDMPKEFKNLQGQDMGKIGFLQDLIRGIEKIIGKSSHEKNLYANNQTGVVTTSDSLLERVFDEYLIGGHWDKAFETCDRVLDSEPKNARAFLGKFMAQLKVYEEDSLRCAKQDYEQNENFQKAVQYSQPEYANKLMNYLHSTLYNLGKNSFNENDFLIAHDFFKRSDYENSKEMQQKCIDELEHIENIKDTFTKTYLKYDLYSNNIKHSQETELCIQKQKELNKKYPYGADSPSTIVILLLPAAIAEILSGLVVIFFLLFSDKIVSSTWDEVFNDGIINGFFNFNFNSDVLNPIIVFVTIAFFVSFIGFLVVSGYERYKLLLFALSFPYVILLTLPGCILTSLCYPYGWAVFIILGIILLIAPIHAIRKYKNFNILEKELNILSKKKDDALSTEVKNYFDNFIVQYPNISDKTINNCLNEIKARFKPRIFNTKKINER